MSVISASQLSAPYGPAAHTIRHDYALPAAWRIMRVLGDERADLISLATNHARRRVEATLKGILEHRLHVLFIRHIPTLQHALPYGRGRHRNSWHGNGILPREPWSCLRARFHDVP